MTNTIIWLSKWLQIQFSIWLIFAVLLRTGQTHQTSFEPNQKGKQSKHPRGQFQAQITPPKYLALKNTIESLVYSLDHDISLYST